MLSKLRNNVKVFNEKAEPLFENMKNILLEKANTVYSQITEDTTETKTYIFHVDNSEYYDAVKKYDKYYENVHDRKMTGLHLLLSNINNENLYGYKLCYEYCMINYRKNIYFDTSKIGIKNSMKKCEKYILNSTRLAYNKIEEESLQGRSMLMICKYDDLFSEFRLNFDHIKELIKNINNSGEFEVQIKLIKNYYDNETQIIFYWYE